MHKQLPIALAQIKAGNTSEILLNEIRQIIYCLYREKEVIWYIMRIWYMSIWYIV